MLSGFKRSSLTRASCHRAVTKPIRRAANELKEPPRAAAGPEWSASTANPSPYCGNTSAVRPKTGWPSWTDNGGLTTGVGSKLTYILAGGLNFKRQLLGPVL